MKKSLTSYADIEIKAIHAKSRRLNRFLKNDHSYVLLDMIEKHIEEIKDRYSKADKHYLIETGDLIVLCLELINEAKQSSDEVLSKCYPRFHKKLDYLIKTTC
ncbi:MAG: hypothetical protein WCH62_04410 [Candidatus Omnitrophota bacterium]